MHNHKTRFEDAAYMRRQRLWNARMEIQGRGEETTRHGHAASRADDIAGTHPLTGAGMDPDNRMKGKSTTPTKNTW